MKLKPNHTLFILYLMSLFYVLFIYERSIDLSWIVQDQNTEEPESGCYECQDHMQSQLFY